MQVPARHTERRTWAHASVNPAKRAVPLAGDAEPASCSDVVAGEAPPLVPPSSPPTPRLAALSTAALGRSTEQARLPEQPSGREPQERIKQANGTSVAAMQQVMPELLERVAQVLDRVEQVSPLRETPLMADEADGQLLAECAERCCDATSPQAAYPLTGDLQQVAPAPSIETHVGASAALPGAIGTIGHSAASNEAHATFGTADGFTTPGRDASNSTSDLALIPALQPAELGSELAHLMQKLVQADGAQKDGLHELIVKVASHQRKSITRIQAIVRKRQATRRWQAVSEHLQGLRGAAGPAAPWDVDSVPEAEASIIQLLREEPNLLRQVQRVVEHQRRSVSKLQALARGRHTRRTSGGQPSYPDAVFVEVFNN